MARTAKSVKPKRPVPGSELTRLQTPSGAFIYFMGTYQLPTWTAISYEFLRKVRKCPTVALVRSYLITPMVSVGYSVQCENEDEETEKKKEVIEQWAKNIIPLHLWQAASGQVDLVGLVLK